ncbi:MAG: glycosyltransferase family 2 protein [Nostocaceae cyanobacterium]|nr:glycosyltransferase family 2 protein [Nostocaceae cyanobacterium]
MLDNNDVIRVSVALVTRNRPESLNRCLKSLRSQSIQPFEVVISDDSDEEFAIRTKELAERWNCQYIKGPQRGLYANRNHVALACNGTHIRTMDDDHEFPADHFKVLQAVVESDSDSIWIIGEYWEKPTPSSKFYLPGEIQPRGFSKLPSNLDDCFAISDGAAIYPKQVFANQRLLEVFKFGSLYLEFGARLKSLGYRIRYCPDTYIIHHYIPGSRSFNDEKMQKMSNFLAAYLTYSCYLFDLFKTIECTAYFLAISLLNTFNKESSNYFTLRDFWKVLKLSNKYKNLFKSGNYQRIN